MVLDLVPLTLVMRKVVSFGNGYGSKPVVALAPLS